MTIHLRSDRTIAPSGFMHGLGIQYYSLDFRETNATKLATPYAREAIMARKAKKRASPAGDKAKRKASAPVDGGLCGPNGDRRSQGPHRRRHGAAPGGRWTDGAR